MHQVYLSEVKTLRPKRHLERGLLRARYGQAAGFRIPRAPPAGRPHPGEGPASPPAALSGLDHLGGKLYLSLSSCRSYVQGDLLDGQGPHPGVVMAVAPSAAADRRAGSHRRSGAGIDGMVLIVQVTALNRPTPIESRPRATDLSLRLHIASQRCHT